MLSQEDINYLSSGLIDFYSQIGYNMKFVPLNRTSSVVNNYGEMDSVFADSSAFTVFGELVFVEEEYKEIIPKGNNATGRIDAWITIVYSTFIANGIEPRDGDAIDVTNAFNVTERYIIAGISRNSRRNDFPYILTDFLVTKLENIADVQ